MSNTSGDSTFKTIMQVFAILFSIVLVPVLIVIIPAGGVAVTAVDAISKENIESVIENAEVAGEIYHITMEETLKETDSIEGLRKEVADEIFREMIRVEDVEDVIAMIVDSAYSGKRASVDFSAITERVVEKMTEVFVDGIDEVHDYWKNGTISTVFTESFCEDTIREMEQNLLTEYSGYQAIDFSELEKAYDAEHGDGAFERLVEAEMKKVQEEVVREIKAEIPDIINESIAEVEEEMEDDINEAVLEPEFRDVMDVVQEADEYGETIKMAVYVLIFGIVIFLLVFYLFDTPGFVVTAIPVIIGGALCKGIQFMEGMIFSLLEEGIAESSSGIETIDNLVRTVFEELLHPVFSNIGKFGTVMLIAGVLLIGLAILRHVLKKQKQVTESSYN